MRIVKEFSYYLDNLDTLKPRKFANDMEILQLPPGTTYLAKHKYYLINLYISFHPDKVCPAEKVKAKACFQLIYPAVRRFLSIKSSPVVSFEDLIDELLPVSVSHNKSTPRVTARDSFEVLYNELVPQKSKQAALFLNRQPAENSQAALQQQLRLFAILKAKASTPNEMVKVLKFQHQKSEGKEKSDFGHPADSILLQRATNAGYPEAMLMTADYTFLGYYGSKPEPIKWALDCIRYLDAMIKKPETRDMDTDVAALRFRIKNEMYVFLPNPIPAESTQGYQKLVIQLQLKTEKIKNIKAIIRNPVPPRVSDLRALIQIPPESDSAEAAPSSAEVIASPVSDQGPSGALSRFLNSEPQSPSDSFLTSVLPLPAPPVDEEACRVDESDFDQLFDFVGYPTTEELQQTQVAIENSPASPTRFFGLFGSSSSQIAKQNSEKIPVISGAAACAEEPSANTELLEDYCEIDEQDMADFTKS